MLHEMIQIVPYTHQYKAAFQTLNEEWVSSYFELEPEDIYLLQHPEEAILAKGGYIFIALYQQDAVGTCALVPSRPNSFELSKMCVAPQAQGKHLGTQLCEAAIQQARTLGAAAVFLESNRKLTTAIRLYSKLGFVEIPVHASKYNRVDIMMELIL